MKRIVALTLAIFAVVALASCKKIDKTPDETTVPAETTNVGTEKTPATDVVTEPETEAVTDAETDAVTEAETTAAETTAASSKMTKELALSIARDYLGERDADTGYLFSYQFVEITAEGEYKIKVSWYIEEDERYSTYGYLLISESGKVTEFDW